MCSRAFFHPLPRSLNQAWGRLPRKWPPGITGRHYKNLRPGLETTFYDARCVQVIDPFGNRIRFNEDLKPAKAT